MRRTSRARIAVVGLPFYGGRAARFLRAAGFAADYVETASPGPAAVGGGWAVARADLVYAIGSSVRSRGPLDLVARAGKQIVMHWVGTDVQDALEAWHARCVSERLLTGAVHAVDAAWLAGELRLLGLRAEEHPLPVNIATGEPAPLPDEFRVLVYLPGRPHAAYDVEGTLAAMRALPGVPFLVAGGYTGELPSNARALGFVEDMDPVYRDASAVLRLTHHDGLSHTVVEALSYGRHVVWSRPFPGVLAATGAESAAEHLGRLAGQARAGQLSLNEVGLAASEPYRPENVLIRTRDWLRGVLAAR